MNLDTGRPATLAYRGMVTSPHALASQAGVAILQAGGSAVDAAIAAAAVLSVDLPPHDEPRRRRLLADPRRGHRRGALAGGGGPRGGRGDHGLVRGPRAPRDPGARDRARHAHRARRGGRLVPGARGPRPAAARHRPGRRRRLRARRLPGHAAARAVDRALGRRARGGSGGRAHLPGRRAEPGGGPAAQQSGSRAHARARGRGAGRLLRGGDRAGDGATRARARRLLHRARLRRAARDVGRLHPRHLSRRHHPPDAAAEPGRVGFAIAPAARAAGDRRAALPGAGPRAPARAGQADRLPRPGPLRRRSRVLPGAGRALAIPRLRRRAAGPHGPGARAALGPRPVERQPGRRYGLRRGGGRRRQRGLADPEPLLRLRLGRGGGQHRRRAAEPRRLLLARSRASQPARARQAAAAHADRVPGLQGWAPLAGRGLHGRRRPAADPPAGLHRADRLRARHPAGRRGAPLARRALRPGRRARSAEPGGPLRAGHHRRAGAAGPRDQSLGGLERARRARPRHHDRSRSGARVGGADPRSDGAAIGYWSRWPSCTSSG